jgi:hypothetical protein
MTTHEEASDMHTPDGPASPDGVAAPVPGRAPLSPIQQQALILAVRVAILEVRLAVGARLQRGEPLASVESDLGPLVTDRMRPITQVLEQLDPLQGFTAAEVVAWCALLEAVEGDLQGLKQLVAVSTAPRPSAGD